MSIRSVVGFVVGGLAVAALFVRVASRRADRSIRLMVDSLWTASRNAGQGPVEIRDYRDLPAPVARYLARVIPQRAQAVRRARFAQSGMFRIKDEPERWRPFEAVQHVTTSPPGFVWDARIRMAPALAVRVADAYQQGSGMLRARLAGAFTVADAAGPEIDSGELMRYLSEAIWYPSALADRERVSWRAIDDTSAVASLKDANNEAELTFHFDGEALVHRIEGVRFRGENGRFEKLPWIAHCGDYEVRHGYCIPTTARVSWGTPEGESEYFRGRITSIEYET